MTIGQLRDRNVTQARKQVEAVCDRSVEPRELRPSRHPVHRVEIARQDGELPSLGRGQVVGCEVACAFRHRLLATGRIRPRAPPRREHHGDGLLCDQLATHRRGYEVLLDAYSLACPHHGFHGGSEPQRLVDGRHTVDASGGAGVNEVAYVQRKVCCNQSAGELRRAPRGKPSVRRNKVRIGQPVRIDLSARALDEAQDILCRGPGDVTNDAGPKHPVDGGSQPSADGEAGRPEAGLIREGSQVMGLGDHGRGRVPLMPRCVIHNVIDAASHDLKGATGRRPRGGKRRFALW